MYRCIESIKLLNGCFIRLQRHQTRVDKAFETLYPNYPAIQLAPVLAASSFPLSGLYKCRIVFDTEIRLIEFTPYKLREIKTLKLVETDAESCEFKHENREDLNKAFRLRADCDDVLLVKNGLLTDSSYANIALFDGKNWITPKHPIIYGTNRAQLLADRKITEADINVHELPNFLKIRLFNAMIEFGETETDINCITH